MYNIATTPDAIVSQRILDLFAQDKVFSFNEILSALANVADADQVRSVLANLQRRRVVMLRPHRRGVWFMGYAAGDMTHGWQPDPEEIPQPFRALLSQLSW